MSTKLAHAARRGLRRLQLRLRSPSVRFVLGRHYEIEIPGSPHDPERGRRIVSFLLEENLTDRRAIQTPRPASMRALRRVHTDDYLESLQRSFSLEAILGATLPEDRHDEFLVAQREMTGGTLLATRLAMAGSGIAVNLGGGFHHARSDLGQGFCVYNDIAVAIAKWRASGFRGQVLVVDLDLHDGDGTREIFARDPTVHTFSIHNRDLGAGDAVASTSIALGADVGDEAYLRTVREALPEVLREFHPALAFYVAGCDPAWDDALGNWRICGDALVARDRFVLEKLRGGPAPVPVVVLLGGGYGNDAWRHGARLAANLLGHPRVEPPRTSELTLARFRQIFHGLRVSQLTADHAGDDWQLEESDLLPLSYAPGRSSRLLDYYSRHGIELALERYGLYDRLRRKGFEDLVIELDLDDPAGQTARLRTAGPDSEVLIEGRVRRDRRTIPGMELLAVEWLLLQNPHASFGNGREPLPGQQHPGLGMLREVSALLMMACERLELDGLLVVPAHYHIAALSTAHGRFLEPEDQARFEKLSEAVRDLRLTDASRAIDAGHVRDSRTGEPVAWRPTPMIVAVTPRLRRRMQGECFQRRVSESLGRFAFELVRPPANGEPAT